MARYRDQGPAEWQGGKRVSENEHVIPKGKQKAVTFDPTTGTSDYTDSHYENNTTLRLEREAALNKTHANRGGANADNAGTARLKAKAKSGDPNNGINYREEVFGESVDNMHRAARDTNSGVTEGQVNESALAQDGELFGVQRLKDTGKRIGVKPADVNRAIASADPNTSLELRRTIDTGRRQARQTLKQVNEIAPVLEKNIEAAKGDHKKGLIAKRGLLEKKRDEAIAAIERADADLEALANPSTRHEDLVAIKARHGAKGSMAPQIEVDSAGKLTPGKATSRDTTVTTTSLDKGKATVEKTRTATKLGVDGVSSTQSHDKVVTGKDGVVRTGASNTSKMSLTGKASVERKASHEVELADGRKAGVEASTTSEVSAGGALEDDDVDDQGVRRLVGSKTSKQSVDHGDGKLTATTSPASPTRTRRAPR